MTRLRLVSSEPEAGVFEAALPFPQRLSPGRHGIPADLVVQHQRQRLIAAMAEALAEHGYAQVTAAHVSEGAGVSSRTFYKHFGNLWDCLLVAYEAAAERLCDEIEAACAGQEEQFARLPAAISAALAFLASEPALARLVVFQPPVEAPAPAIARRQLIARLANMLGRSRESSDEAPVPRRFDERRIDAAFALLANRIVAGKTDSLLMLGPELTQMLAGRGRAA